MQGVAHNPAFAEKVAIPQSVGKDFAAADHGKSLAGLPERKKSPLHDHPRSPK